jgi:hypothetical protein
MTPEKTKVGSRYVSVFDNDDGDSCVTFVNPPNLDRLESDALLVRHSPCNPCGRKSTARGLFYGKGDGFYFLPLCDDHRYYLKMIVDEMVEAISR